jgi:glycosyltransferase involved in cell wall biosynthesis
MFKLSAEIKKYNPHIIQTWLYHSDILGLMANWISGNRPLVWNLRCSNIDLYEENRRTAFLLKVLAPLSPFPNLVLANSDAALAYHHSVGFKPKAQKVIANGFCGDHFRPSEHRRQSLRAEWGVTENNVLIGMIARVAAMKDHDIFLDAAISISAEMPNIKFLLVGKGTEPNMPLAQSQKALALKGKILWLGQRSDIQDIMGALDIATLTSKCGESFPNVLAEAMLCGTPCVTTDVGAAAVIIGDTGLVIPSGQPACLMKAWWAMAKLSAGSRQSLGASARMRILEHFSLDEIARQYADTYRQMLG